MTIIPHLLLLITCVAFATSDTPFGRSELGARGTSSTPESTSTPLINSSFLIWQPLRATFQPLNRQPSSAPPPPPEPLALTSTEVDTLEVHPSSSQAPPSTTTSAPSTASSVVSLDEEDQPTRVPLNRFRPTKPPSVDAQSQPQPPNPSFPINPSAPGGKNLSLAGPYKISNECFECICEASTNCNPNSRCQTSDVRHTRCGLFLINYDQWLETGLSKTFVTREAIARDPAADERAFYECVTDRDCAERLLSIYLQKNTKDCDKDGRIDCYDMAAIHQGGPEHCNSERLLESQYWSDFSACFGFGR